MKPRLTYVSNDQDFIAEKFRISDNHLISASKIAMLKIQSLKFAMRTPEIGLTYRQSVEEIIRHSFFTFIPASLVLSEESFYFTPRDN
ncbi:MAG: hypothetical protein ACKVOW_16800 [Chitinophagaceae bacterium]